MSNYKLVNWGLFILLSFIWGSSFILMKLSSQQLNGWQIASIRIFSAGLLFLPFAIKHIASLPKNKLGLVALTGLLGNLLPAYLFAIAIDQKVNSSLAGILNSLTPLFVIVFGLLFFKARVNTRKIAGVFIGFTGLLILSLSKGGITIDNFWFSLLVLLATLFYGLNVNIVSVYLKDVDPFKMATVSLAFMCLPAGIIVFQQGLVSMFIQDASYRLPILAATILGVAGSAIATALFYVLIKRAGGLFASLVTYGIPFVAILWGLVYQEEVTLIQIGCLVIILSGVYLTNK